MPGGDPFDLFGAMAVLREANFFETSGRPDLVYDYEVVSNEPGTVFAAEGLRIVVDKPCYDIRGDVDTVVFQAIDYEGKCLRDQRFIAWIRRISKRARRVVTACVGTYLLAEAGLLDGRRAATHWGADKDFRRRYPDVILDTEPIYVKDGHLYTSAGATSILDLMLALVEEDFGSELALRMAQGLVMFLRRPANQSQFSVQLTGLKTDDERIRDVVSHIAKNPGSDLTVERLGELAGMSPRNFTRDLCPRDRHDPREVRRGVEARERAPIPRTVDDARRRDCPRVRLQHHGRNAAGLRPKPGCDAARIPAAILLKAIPPPRTRPPTRRSRAAIPTAGRRTQAPVQASPGAADLDRAPRPGGIAHCT